MVWNNSYLAILVFLVVSSGVTKIMLMPQDVVFFGKYGFTNVILIAYGVTQLIGAVIVAITFLISAVVLFMEENILFTIVTFVAVAFLGMVMKQSLNKEKPVSV